MPALIRRRRLAATTALLAAVSLSGVLGGCSDGSDPSSTPAPTTSSSTSSSASSSASSTASSTPSATPSVTPSSTATPEPEAPKPPKVEDTDAGRRAFAEFVVASWGYALRTNDASAVTDLSPRSGPCQGCAELAAELKKRARQGWYVDFPGAKVVKVEVQPGAESGVHVARATIDVPASRSYFEDGALRNENKARKGATFEVQMRLDGKRYALLAFRVA